MTLIRLAFLKKLMNIYEIVLNMMVILMTDDINMKALSGSIKDKINSITNAGYDLILHCLRRRKRK